MMPALLITLIVSGCADLLKAQPIIDELRRRRPDWSLRLIYTGSPNDGNLPASALEELCMQGPDVCLDVTRGQYLGETVAIMQALQQEFSSSPPDAVMVVGDRCGTLAGGLAAAQLGIPLAHVEAGLRSFDRQAPGEINRVLSDAVSRWLFTTERPAVDNLRAEGLPDQRIHFVGSTLVDNLIRHRGEAADLHAANAAGAPGTYALVALSKPENVDDPLQRRSIAYALLTLADEFDVICTVSRHAAERLRALNLAETIAGHRHLRLLPGVGYVEFLSLLNDAAAVLTDSGGVQQEAVVLGTPCVTLNRYTKHQVTLTHAGNRLAGVDPHLAVRYVREAICGRAGFAPIPEAWDGKAAARIVDVLERDLAASGSAGWVLPVGSAEQI